MNTLPVAVPTPSKCNRADTYQNAYAHELPGQDRYVVDYVDKMRSAIVFK